VPGVIKLEPHLTSAGKPVQRTKLMNDENKNGAGTEVKRLVDLLQYQPGSIVSRVLLKNQGGTVTMFAFDAGEGLSEHTAPFDALVLVTDGEADIDVAGRSFTVGQAESIVLPANQPHAVKAVSRFKMLLTMLRA
jgi:quercetin dioxygenase-like cupin family protein